MLSKKSVRMIIVIISINAAAKPAIVFLRVFGATGALKTCAVSMVLIEPTPTAFSTYCGAILVKLLQTAAETSAFFVVAVTLTAEVSITDVIVRQALIDSGAMSPLSLILKFWESVFSSN